MRNIQRKLYHEIYKSILFPISWASWLFATHTVYSFVLQIDMISLLFAIFFVAVLKGALLDRYILDKVSQNSNYFTDSLTHRCWDRGWRTMGLWIELSLYVADPLRSLSLRRTYVRGFKSRSSIPVRVIARVVCTLLVYSNRDLLPSAVGVICKWKCYIQYTEREEISE